MMMVWACRREGTTNHAERATIKGKKNFFEPFAMATSFFSNWSFHSCPAPFPAFDRFSRGSAHIQQRLRMAAPMLCGASANVKPRC
jgi:hypothetical protein